MVCYSPPLRFIIRRRNKLLLWYVYALVLHRLEGRGNKKTGGRKEEMEGRRKRKSRDRKTKKQIFGRPVKCNKAIVDQKEDHSMTCSAFPFNYRCSCTNSCQFVCFYQRHRNSHLETPSVETTSASLDSKTADPVDGSQYPATLFRACFTPLHTRVVASWI